MIRFVDSSTKSGHYRPDRTRLERNMNFCKAQILDVAQLAYHASNASMCFFQIAKTATKTTKTT